MGKETERERIRHTNIRLSSVDTYILFLVRSENGVSLFSLILSDISPRHGYRITNILGPTENRNIYECLSIIEPAK